MKIQAALVILLIFFISCSKQSELSKDFNCKIDKKHNTSSVSDFNKNFKIGIPNSWKTELYYDNITSEIFTADTTKQLTETFILDASFNLGEVEFNNEFLAKTDSLAALKNYEIIKHKTITFQSKESFWCVLKGTKNNFPYHQFNLTVKLSDNTYSNSYVEIYGDDKIDERICEAISIINKIEFLQ